MNSKITILYIYQELDFGGAEGVLAARLKNINKKKYDIIICCIGKKSNLGNDLKDKGFLIIELDRDYGVLNLHTTYVIYKLIKKFRPHIVHTSLFYANFHGRIAAKFAKVPVIICEEQNIYKWKTFIFRFIDRVLAYFTDKIIACSNTVKNFTVKQEKILEDKFIVIHNTFDTERFEVKKDSNALRTSLGVASEDKIIGTIGRLCEQKGHEFLISAMPQIKKEIKGCRLIIVGEGPLKDSLIRKVKEVNCYDDIIFMDKIKDIPNFLEMIDLFVFPSLWEGLPVALLEAMYMKKSIVVTRIGSNLEVVGDSDMGILVSPGNVNELSRAIITLLNDTTKAKEIGFRARERVIKHFAPPIYIAKLEKLYDELVLSKR